MSGLSLMERLELAECHAVHGPDVTDAVSLIQSLKTELASYVESDGNLRKKVEELEARVEPLQPFKGRIIELEAKHTALEDGLRPIATEMIEPECPEDEVDDCETCQCFIDWGNRILALIGKES